MLATVFRMHLVTRINEVTDTVWQREALVTGALTAHLALVEARGTATAGLTLAHLRDLVFALVAELHAQREARGAVEAAYLAGHTALFPDATLAWVEQVHRSEEAAVIALRLVELDGGPPLDEDYDGVADPARVAACVADLVEAARIKALDQLGDGWAAINRAIHWLRPSLAPEGEGPTRCGPRAWRQRRESTVTRGYRIVEAARQR